MTEIWANEFREIPPTLLQRGDLRQRMLTLLAQPMPGKVTEGRDRLERFRGILADLVNGGLSLEQAYQETAHQLARYSSPHAHNNRVFCDGWEERLVRTQLSRLYNQAVLEHLLNAGEVICFVPHSSEEDPAGRCALHLAGREHDVALLHRRLLASYTRGEWSADFKVPEHPHCSHVVRPVSV